MKRLLSERGGLEFAELISGTLGAICMVWMITATEQFGTEFNNYQTYVQTVTPVHAALSQMDEEAASSAALAIPGTDVLGNDNSDNHEIDFVEIVVSGAGSNTAHFIAYLWDSTNKVLTRYTYLHHPGTTPTQQTTWQVPATAFTTSFIKMSDAPTRIPAAAFLAALSPNDVQLINVGYPGFNAGNRELRVTIANADVSETDYLVQGEYATHVTYNTGTFTPTPPPTPTPTPPPSDVQIWPPAVMFAENGQSLVQGSTCAAQPYKGTGFGPISTPPPWVTVTLDANNCYNGRIWVQEAGYSGSFVESADTNCGVNFSVFSPNSNGPGPDRLVAAAGTQPADVCGVSIQGDPDAANNGVVTSNVEVIGCDGGSGTNGTGILPVGMSCTLPPPPESDDTGECDIGSGEGGGADIDYKYEAATGPGTFNTANQLLTRTGVGQIQITEIVTTRQYHPPNPTCAPIIKITVYAQWVIN